MRKFWNWIKNEDGRVLRLDGPIAEETWWGDEVTPKMFKDELQDGSGSVTVWINSPGGDVFAAAQIYNMLMDYTGAVTVKIDGLAASAASVIAMAGGDVLMSPVSMMMCHNPAKVVDVPVSVRVRRERRAFCSADFDCIVCARITGAVAGYAGIAFLFVYLLI